MPAGALPGATELRVSRVADAFTLPDDVASDPGVVAAFQARFTAIDRVRVEADTARFLAPLRLVLPAPPGATPADRFIVVRTRSVAMGGALADLDAVTGIPLAQNPRRVVERLEIVESASVKTVDGQLVLSTDSPPFAGITEPDLLTVLLVNESLTFLTGEVRRDSLTGPTVANAVVQTLPGDEAMAPFAATANDAGVFVVADGSIAGPLAAGATISSRLDVSDPLFQRVIRRDVRAIVQPTAPPNTVIAELVEPFVLPAVLPPSFTLILGDLEPPGVEIAFTGPSLVEGFTRAGDPVTATVTARDNDILTFVGLELDQGSGFEAVQLTAAGTFTVTPGAPALLTFRAHARDRQGNETFAERHVRAADASADGGFIVGPLQGPPVPIEPESQPASSDGDIEVPVSEPLDPTTVNEDTVQLHDPEGLPVEIEVALEGNGTVIRVNPRRLLRLGACYTLTLSNLIRDLAGELLGGATFNLTIPPPTHVTTIRMPNTNDVAIDQDLMVAVNTPDSGGVFGAGAIHAFRILDNAGLPLDNPVRLTAPEGFATNGRPLSVALERDRAYVGNRFLGAIATQQPLIVPFIPTAFMPNVDTILGCGVELTLTVVCTGLTSIWHNLPQPASNLQVLDLADPAQPRMASGRALNFIPPDTWNPNTWPDRVEITDQGVAVLNFNENVEVFTRTPRSLGTIGRIRRYGEVTTGLGFLDVSYLRGGVGVLLEGDGLRIVSTSAVQDPLAREAMTTLGFISIAGAHGGRVGTVSGYHWIDAQGQTHVTDLAFVASRTLGLQVFAINGPTLFPPASPASPRLLDTMSGVFGTMSFDACRGVAYVYGFNGRFHVIDFTDPADLRELNAPGTGLAFQLSGLGSRLTFNGNANSNGRVFLAGDAGVAIVDTGGCTRLGGTCGQAGGPVTGPVQIPQCPISPSALLNPNCAADRCFGDELQTSIDDRPQGTPVVLAVGGVSTLRLTLDASASGPVHVFLTATGQGDVTFGQRDVLLSPGSSQTVSLSAAVPSGSAGDTAIQLHMGSEDGPVCISIPVTVVALNIQIDSNNDTSVNDLDDADEEDSPFVFWTHENAGDAVINGKNDLENFALLKLRVTTPALLQLPAGYRFELQLDPISGGFASINLFRRIGRDFDRFTPSVVAEQQAQETRLLQLTTAGGQDLPFSEFAGDTATLLLEGVTPGRARIRLALIGPGDQELFADEALIELKPVRQFYSVAYARELPIGDDPVLFWPYRGEGFAEQLDPAKNATLVFVHGFNVAEAGAFASFDGVYRRFYWSKLTGPGGTADLVGFTWTGEQGQAGLPLQYNRNVFNAFQASVRFREFIGELRAARPSGAINVMAHSLGNGVVSNAIQMAALDGQNLGIGTYLLHQAAIAVNAYGPTGAGLHPSLVSQARDWGYPNDVPRVHLGLVEWDPPRWRQYPASDPWGGYFNLVRSHTRLVNMFSLADCVLGIAPFAASAWWVNQQGSRPDCTILYPDGPAGAPHPLPLGIPGCDLLASHTWADLPDGPAPSQPPVRERQWGELSYYFNDLTETAGVAWMPGATNIDGEPLGISGSCLSSPTGGVHSAFTQKPLGHVWQFWNCASSQLGGGGFRGSCTP
ncbi:MAG: alpha/beta hydrolase [Vicinamibacterales bacterium]